MNVIDKKIHKLQTELKQALRERDIKRGRKKFPCECGCGKKYSIEKCRVVQTEWYVEPFSCTGGDYWLYGELQIICPTSQVRNRVLFIDEKSLEDDFKFKYKRLFKEVIKHQSSEDKKLPTKWVNNEYFLENFKYFELRK